MKPAYFLVLCALCLASLAQGSITVSDLKGRTMEVDVLSYIPNTRMTTSESTGRCSK